jgi:hypothetical protein
MWKEGGPFCEPYIAQMTEGHMDICRFDITAKRGPQNGVFVFAHTFEETKKKGNFKHTYFGGIGCSGYIDKVEAVLTKLGREKDINDDDWCSGSECLGGKNTIYLIENCKTGERIVYWDESKNGEYNYSNDWVGVKKETVKEFFCWLDSLAEDFDSDMKKWIARCKKSKKLRYNQGNAFFTAHAGMKLEATEVGKSKTPTALKLIGKGKKRKK